MFQLNSPQECHTVCFACPFAGAKWGIKSTLLTGLCLQIIGVCILMAWQDSWGNEGEEQKIR